MDSSATIGVVTVTYNSGAVIREFMEALLKQSHGNFLLYVVDNASSDDTLAQLAGYSDPRVIVIRNSTNVGVAEGNNIGIRAALSDACTSVLLINNDTVFGPNAVSELHEGLEKYQCDMIVPKILYFDSSDKVWSAGGTFSRLRGRSKHFGFGARDDGRFDQMREVEYSPTCCMLIRIRVFERIGIMDPKYFVYFDDADFCLRAHRSGIRLVYSPGIRVYHKVSSLIGYRSDLSLRYVTRNHVYYVLKNFRLWQIMYYLPICQAHILVRCCFAKNIARGFLIAQKAFWEGVLLFYFSQRSQEVLHLPEGRFESALHRIRRSSDNL